MGGAESVRLREGQAQHEIIWSLHQPTRLLHLGRHDIIPRMINNSSESQRSKTTSCCGCAGVRESRETCGTNPGQASRRPKSARGLAKTIKPRGDFGSNASGSRRVKRAIPPVCEGIAFGRLVLGDGVARYRCGSASLDRGSEHRQGRHRHVRRPRATAVWRCVEERRSDRVHLQPREGRTVPPGSGLSLFESCHRPGSTAD